ncbi:pimeloyl-ACP methyl ester carboxylesterase [Stenotrophomonas sp. AN71]
MLSGELQGAPWRLDVPQHWNGDLVMLTHGYEPVGVPRTTPMTASDSTAPLLAAGYAVAQSAYASQGWAVADAITDNERLRQHVLTELKRVRHTWILGFSMGGAVTIASLERFPQHYAGGVSLCGANLAGEQIAADLLTTLLAFDYFFPKADGLPTAGLASREAAGLPQATLYQGIASALQRDPQHAAVIARQLQVSSDALPGTISLHALVLHELATRSGGMPVGNVGVVYSGFGDDAAFNAGVRRIDAVPSAQAQVRATLALTGRVKRPLVIQFNSNDPTIVPHMQTVYPQLAAQVGARPLPRVLPAVGEGHCDFSEVQVVQALKAARS